MRQATGLEGPRQGRCWHSCDWAASSGASTLSSSISSFFLGHDIIQVRTLRIKASDSGLGSLGCDLSSLPFQRTGHGTGACPGTVQDALPPYCVGSAVGTGQQRAPPRIRSSTDRAWEEGLQGRAPGTLLRRTWFCYSLHPHNLEEPASPPLTHASPSVCQPPHTVLKVALPHQMGWFADNSTFCSVNIIQLGNQSISSTWKSFHSLMNSYTFIENAPRYVCLKVINPSAQAQKLRMITQHYDSKGC